MVPPWLLSTVTPSSVAPPPSMSRALPPQIVSTPVSFPATVEPPSRVKSAGPPARPISKRLPPMLSSSMTPYNMAPPGSMLSRLAPPITREPPYTAEPWSSCKMPPVVRPMSISPPFCRVTSSSVTGLVPSIDGLPPVSISADWPWVGGAPALQLLSVIQLLSVERPVQISLFQCTAVPGSPNGEAAPESLVSKKSFWL